MVESSAAGEGTPPVRKRPRRLGAVLHWELRRLFSQLRIQVLLVVCLSAPLLFVAAIEIQPTVPADTLFGRAVHDSGLAVPLFILGFASLWGLPAVAAVVAGDLFSAEDRQGTWALLLTRSRTRSEIVVAKLLAGATTAVVALIGLAASSIISGVVFVGSQPLIGLSGQLLSGTHAVTLVAVAFALTIMPTLTFVALAAALSAVSRNGVVGIAAPMLIALVLQGLSLVDLPAVVHALLPTTAFESWHGLLADPPFASSAVWGLIVSVCWSGIFVALTHRLVTHRDLGRS